MSRVYNFSAGPAVLPETVLKEVADEMMDYQGSGMSVMEMSHRSPEFQKIIDDAEKDLRDLMNIPDNYKVLFLQGGASQQFAMIPMNLMKNRVADYIVTGQWAKKAYQEAQKYGILHKEKEPYEVLSTNWLSYREILKLKRVESMVEVYYNSGQFQNTLEYLVPQFEDAFIFYEKLGAFYEEKGYSEISHSRMRRYEILLEFLKEETQIDAETAAQYMLYDLYLRERLKKRPSFAADQKPYESAVWAYRKEHRISRTAHIEVFPGGKAILFDYENRNPLSNNAATENVVLRMDNEIE
mgnify:CR=1 FL=1